MTTLEKVKGSKQLVLLKQNGEGMKIIVDTKYYGLQQEKRLLVPFIHENTGLIGFINRRGHVIIPHSYDCVYDDFYDKEDVVRVALADSKGNLVKTIISANGKVLFKEIYKEIMMSVDRHRFVVENLKGQWAVVDREEKVIVPYEKYDWIDGFRNGFARVKQGKITNGKTEEGKLWGIINTDGKEVLPVAFPNIHSFADELNDYITAKKDFITIEFFEEEKVESIHSEGFYEILPCPSRIKQVSFDTLENASSSIGADIVREMESEKEKYLQRIDDYNKNLSKMKRIHQESLFDKPEYDPYDNREWLHRYDGSTEDAYEGEPDTRWNTD